MTNHECLINALAEEYKDNAIGGFIELKSPGFHPELGEVFNTKSGYLGATLPEAMEAAQIAGLDIIFVEAFEENPDWIKEFNSQRFI